MTKLKPISALFLLCSIAAAEPITTDSLLRRAGKALDDFLARLPAVNCVETVQQQKLDNKGKTISRQDASFDYLALLQMSGNDVLVDESRAPVKEEAGRPQARADAALLVTNGFPTLALIFHPAFQSDFEYGQPEEVVEEGRSLYKIAFRHVEGARSPSALRLRGHNYPVPWAGTAWIDAATGAVTRISTQLASPMDDVGLKTMQAEVRYKPVAFEGQTEAYWLPETAEIEVETARQHWRNVHSFSRFRLFSVSVNVTVTEDIK